MNITFFNFVIYLFITKNSITWNVIILYYFLIIIRYITFYITVIIFYFISYRNDSPNAKYFDVHISSQSMLYKLYIEWLRKNHPDQLPVTSHYYTDCFTKYFPNLHLKKPKSDTCIICDKFFLILNDASIPLEDKRKPQIDLDLHQVFLCDLTMQLICKIIIYVYQYIFFF